ncbi:hypothetical protein ACFLS1_08715 [Verrucomicrobiota bacterium]
MELSIGLLILVIVAVILLGWIVPLIVGIIRLKRKTGGIVLTIIGGIWGVVGLCFAGFIAYGVWSFSQSGRYEVEEFDPAEYKGETAAVIVPCKGETTLFLRGKHKDDSIFRIVTTNMTVQAPVGFVLYQYTMNVADGKGGRWHAGCFLNGRKDKIEIKKDLVNELKVGEPFTARVKVNKDFKDKDVFDLEIKGVDGRKFTIYKISPDSEFPRFEIFSPDNKVLHSDKFEYG